MRFHDLRHGTASLLIASGENLRTVMEVLGHVDIGTTANIYAHISAELKRGAADRLQAALTASTWCALQDVGRPPSSLENLHLETPTNGVSRPRI